jgi:hypothetical protein
MKGTYTVRIPKMCCLAHAYKAKHNADDTHDFERDQETHSPFKILGFVNRITEQVGEAPHDTKNEIDG